MRAKKSELMHEPSLDSQSGCGIVVVFCMLFASVITVIALFCFSVVDDYKRSAWEKQNRPIIERMEGNAAERAQVIFAAKSLFRTHVPDSDYQFQIAMSLADKYKLIEPYMPGKSLDYQSFIGGPRYALDLGLTLDAPVKIWVPAPSEYWVQSE
jgi:hypothetical protein